MCRHGSRFDVTSGAVVGGPAEDPVRSYPVHVANGEVQVDLLRTARLRDLVTVGLGGIRLSA